MLTMEYDYATDIAAQKTPYKYVGRRIYSGIKG